MKIRIKLANGIEINKEFTTEQLQKAEASKQFRQADKKGKKFYYGCDFYSRETCKGCYYETQCNEQKTKRVDYLTNYVNLLNNLN